MTADLFNEEIEDFHLEFICRIEYQDIMQATPLCNHALLRLCPSSAFCIPYFLSRIALMLMKPPAV
jgi:hypothetical protein